MQEMTKATSKSRSSCPEKEPFQVVDYPVTDILAQSLPDFEFLDSYIPILEQLQRVQNNATGFWLDSLQRVRRVLDSQPGPFHYLAEIESNVARDGEDVATQNVFVKRAHILEPVRYMKGLYGHGRDTYLPAPQSTYLTTMNKVNLPTNEAYIDAFGAYLVGKLVEANMCPNFARFYGTLNGRVDEYAYNMTDEFNTFRRERWFPKCVGKLFTIYIEGQTPDETIAYLESLGDEPAGLELSDDELESADESDENTTDTDTTEEINDLHSVELESTPNDSEVISELAPMLDFELASEDIVTLNPTGMHEPLARQEIYAIFKDFPVQITFIEHLDGTMDSLMEGPTRDDSAWLADIFQVMFALAVMQKEYNMIQNDLHTNNVMYSNTDKPYLYYSVDGIIYRIPTHGRIMKVLDFGRATFKFRGQTFFSDAFDPDNDAGGQYNCPPYYDRRRQRVDPNPSFDLARLSSSMIEVLFPMPPPPLIGETGESRILAQEKGKITYETISPLYNLLTEWITDIDGKNVLRKPNGEERYPHFELYCVLAKKIRSAVPCQQFSRPAFEQFRVDSVPPGENIYVL